ncbi:ketopantoate hydroxymethyltransferase [Scopulibacillus darangshiensis]|uniref:3-methyl-2-oxobutanoate hydroxymethyltransferase n=1 Tax=Scopulibacillus darangshiensis TaxID=442528 RepID=A0A4R2PBC8_9BACL|nr:3-methyl-2-oxobutanoate hydroxymethyltransferase [Scopulibacillus darangshiensis]TCP31614.1 ketopantoate hydroxymethyltransferase [Scopulibacillus darangshiensis]
MKSTTLFKEMKELNEPIAMMTAYDFPGAKLAETSGMDLLLVGDSVGMVALGYDSTVPVTIEDMILHTKAVRRGARDTFIVTDMPFLTYHGSFSETLAGAKRLIQEGGAHALKLEGGGFIFDSIERLTHSGVPVMAHLGLTPQSVGVLGGYKIQGKSVEEAKKLMDDAKAAEKAGAFALVLECVPQQLAKHITDELSIPTIGIGAGSHTDGQVLVYHDLIGYGVHRVPKFVKQYVKVSDIIGEGLLSYVNDVKNRTFPGEAHAFNMKNDTMTELYGGS